MGNWDDLTWRIAHDPCRLGDRFPAGAVHVGERVRLKLRVRDGGRFGGYMAWDAWCGRCDAGDDGGWSADALIGSVDLMVRSGGDSWCVWPMDGYDGGFAGEVETSGLPRVIWYAFRLTWQDGRVAYYVPRGDGRSTAGELTACEPGAGFQLTVFEEGFQTPEWMHGAVMYQVFPDRFARGKTGVRREGVEYHERMGRPVHLHDDWNDVVEWEDDTVEYDPVDFYGGSLEGVREKLPYLASLGVEVLYLNPIFEARSNHRYDTADYELIDPILGDAEGFRALAQEARERGISLVLDAVLSHTGDDSRYFDANGTYGETGAVSGEGSPFRSWYDFSPQADGSPYRSWWGHASLPEVNEHDASWQRFMLGCDEGGEGADAGGDADGRSGVLANWLAAGARGYRLDVADELPDDVLKRLRASVKAADPEAVIIGEVWEDATTKVSYGSLRDYALGGSLDSVMNYPLRSALIDFAVGRKDAFQLATFLKLQQANYPKPFYGALMNLLSTHDVERVRSVLALGGEFKDLPREEQYAAVRGITREQDGHAARLQRMIVGMMYALPGAPCIYYGDEKGLQGGGDPFCRATMPWDDDALACRADCGEDSTAFYRELGQLRKSMPVLRRGSLSCVASDSDVLCLFRMPASSPRETDFPGGNQFPAGKESGSLDACPMVVVVANRADEARTVVVDALAPEMGLPVEMRQSLTSCKRSLRVCFDSASSEGAFPEGSCCSGLFKLTVPACSTVIFE